MSVSNQQNKRITKPIESEYLEELASQSVRASTEPHAPPPRAQLAAASVRMPRSDAPASRPTCEMDGDELLGLLAMPDPTASTPPPHPAPAAPWVASPRLVRTRSTSDDFLTQRMQAEHFQALLQDGRAMMPITPALLESVDWYKEVDAAATRAMTARREPEDLLEELDRRPPDDGISEPASGDPGSSAEAPEPVRWPDVRRSAPRLERHAATEMLPIFRPGKPGRDDAEHAIPGTGDRSLPSTHSAGPQILISLIVLVLAGAVLGFVVVELFARLASWI